MLLKKMLPVSVLMFSAILVNCGKNDSKNGDDTSPSIQLPLATASDLLGSWKNCMPISEARTSSGLYSFEADGSLSVNYKTYDSKDCTGDVLSDMSFKGSFSVGIGNALDMTLNWGTTPNTVYRVFTVQGSVLTISNSFGPGGSASNRDTNIATDPMILTKI